MKALSYFRLATLTILLLIALLPAKAQHRKAPIVSREGSWVIETPAKGRQCIVRFYTNESQLIHEETLGRRLKITHQKTKRQLNAALEQAMFVWNATHKMPADRQWVAIQLDKQ